MFDHARKMRPLIIKACLGEGYVMNEARQVYRAISQCPTANLALVLVIFLGSFTTANAQISDYQECSDGLDLQTFGENLTAEERIALMDEEFETELFDTERCEISNSGGGGGGGASGSGGSSSSLATSGSFSSPNALEPGERSVAVNSDLSPVSAAPDSSSSATESGDFGNNGREHEDLASADNKKALADSILKRAEAEDDPDIKAALMKRYKELTK